MVEIAYFTGEPKENCLQKLLEQYIDKNDRKYCTRLYECQLPIKRDDQSNPIVSLDEQGYALKCNGFVIVDGGISELTR